MWLVFDLTDLGVVLIICRINYMRLLVKLMYIIEWIKKSLTDAETHHHQQLSPSCFPAKTSFQRLIKSVIDNFEHLPRSYVNLNER